MPSDSNGVYSLPNGYLATTGDTIQASQHNPPLEDLASAMSLRLMRTGAAPMTGPLKLVDGSPSSPSVQFNSASSTGFYVTPNGIGISVGGVKVAEFNAGGVSRYLGELIPITVLTPPSFTVLPYGQTLSRTTYADMWAVAQTEIAAGNIFYNNGDGSTTFGIGDMRGRVPAGKDNMGGSAAGRLTTTVTSSAIGGTGGGQNITISQSNLPAVSPTFTGTSGTVTVATDSTNVIEGSLANETAGTSSFNFDKIVGGTGFASSKVSRGTFTPAGTISALGSGAPITNIQPTLVCNYLLYVGA